MLCTHICSMKIMQCKGIISPIFVITVAFVVYTGAGRYTIYPRPPTEPPITLDYCYCMIDIRTRSKDDFLPAYLDPKTRTLLYPLRNFPFIYLQTGNSVEIHCPRTEGIVIGKEVTEMKYRYEMILATCLQNYTFKMAGKEVDLRTVRCLKHMPVQLRHTRERCERQSELLHIGYDFLNKFVPIMKLCYTKSERNTVFVYTKISKDLNSWDIESYHPAFTDVPQELSDDSYNIPTKNILYNKDYLLHQINQQLGLESNDTRYINDHYILYPNQLMPHTYFLYPFEKAATYYYINTAPQWTNLNKHVWNVIDIELRDYACFNRIDLIMFIGTMNFLMYPDKDLFDTPLYMHSASKIPIPEAIWKVAIDEKNKAGIVFVAINNPYPYSTHIPICEDISRNLQWLHYINNKFKSKIYACPVQAFNRLFSYASDYEVNRILSFRNTKIQRIKTTRKKFRSRATGNNTFYLIRPEELYSQKFKESNNGIIPTILNKNSTSTGTKK